MKLKFKTTVRDKYTKRDYRKGDIYEFGDERAKEILATGYAEKVEDKMPDEKKEIDETKEETKEIDDLESELDAGNIVNLHDLTLKELQKLAKEEEVSTRGTKNEIIERIMAKYEEEESEDA